ncbi:protocatechuate 3,4-dioxygenase [Glaciimonas immobilis]|uniref:Protocatechuate 3,4-dioxygenase alpha subunit n=1 Tax=Glaciimonas immobilis TaxID=728004 RepID=A0A840RWE6_9BURK|nr:protocatechuate 3,4-dioxygenase [Glaciimonas immobilis]KAF3996364.1 protocatechuate 3,4-dioxygenase [Glaciimonas immobilis]MBB5202205.1 protocatechuate 3,4-dioxygenase alpha subunit [Glaciimonas immobilis]
MTSLITTTQTIGPFPHEAWRWAVDATQTLISKAPIITISGVLRDGDGTPINDGWVEAWLPDAIAAESSQEIPGFRRIPSDDQGGFRIEVSLPTPATAGKPVLYATIFARGLGKHQFTAVFLDDDSGLAQSEILQQVPAERRDTLIARKQAEGQYHWDIWMQSDQETVFFDYV